MGTGGALRHSAAMVAAAFAAMVMAVVGLPGTSAEATPMVLPAGAQIVPQAANSYVALTPTRLADTRPGQPVGFPAVKQRLAAGTTLQVPVEGVAGVPKSQFGSVAALTVTAVDPLAGRHLRVYSCGQVPPPASSVNYAPGQIVANTVVSGMGPGLKVCVYTSTTTHVLVDISGKFL